MGSAFPALDPFERFLVIESDPDMAAMEAFEDVMPDDGELLGFKKCFADRTAIRPNQVFGSKIVAASLQGCCL